MNLQVIYEDNHLIAVNKPAGILVQGDETEDTPLVDYVKDYIKFRYKKPGDVFLGVVHRLDRPVSGAVIFARTSKALTRMNELFKERKVEKNYWAVTERRPSPEAGHLTHYILKDHEKNISKALDQMSNRSKDAKKSDLDYELIGALEGKHLLLVKPITGRPHQIRVQLSKIGCPIVGDLKYGHTQPNNDGSIYLHCRSMIFQHPVTKELVKVVADAPHERLWNQMSALAEQKI
ncbi:MAG: RNA pseudouridine synthase [Haliscomenobacter sp.]|nr:RNA pseudouridine synthase [Haliscomenobacter sp.]MBK9489669.1 RNA pseudouridine synthase [Haliscomenobacter sp.]HPH17667.1 RNA pseudouridine synthase [Haliscomenobacter sp.]